MKLFGLFLIFFGIGMIVYEKIINPEKFKSPEGQALKNVRLFRDIFIIFFGLMLLIFAPWSCG
jgi:hypothetical protein